MKTTLLLLVWAAAAVAQPVRLSLEVQGGVEAKWRDGNSGATDSTDRWVEGRAPVNVVAENVSQAPVVVPCLRFAGSGLVEMPFEIETGVPGWPVAPPPTPTPTPMPGGPTPLVAPTGLVRNYPDYPELKLLAGSPASFELVTVAPGARVVMIGDDAAALELKGPHEAPPMQTATVSVTVTFHPPAEAAGRIAPGPYVSNAVPVRLSAQLNPVPLHQGPGPDPRYYRGPR